MKANAHYEASQEFDQWVQRIKACTNHDELMALKKQMVAAGVNRSYPPINQAIAQLIWNRYRKDPES